MFKFKLQSVLRYREWLEDLKKAAFAEKQRAHEAAKAKARSLRDSRELYFEALRKEASKDEVSITFMNFYHSYIFFLEKKITEQEEVVAEAARVLAEAHGELVEAKKQKEIMVKVREKAFNAHKAEEERVEQVNLDDFSTIKHVRALRGLDNLAS